MTYKTSTSDLDVTQFKSNTEEYAKWNTLEGEEWKKELNALNKQGLTLSYDDVNDVYILEEIVFV